MCPMDIYLKEMYKNDRVYGDMNYIFGNGAWRIILELIVQKFCISAQLVYILLVNII